jgi:hypothetical protein
MVLKMENRMSDGLTILLQHKSRPSAESVSITEQGVTDDEVLPVWLGLGIATLPLLIFLLSLNT